MCGGFIQCVLKWKRLKPLGNLAHAVFQSEGDAAPFSIWRRKKHPGGCNRHQGVLAVL